MTQATRITMTQLASGPPFWRPWKWRIRIRVQGGGLDGVLTVTGNTRGEAEESVIPAIRILLGQ